MAEEAASPASPAELDAFAQSLGDDPFTFGARCLLLRGLASGWIRGPPSAPAGAVVIAHDRPAEAMAFGPDPRAVGSLLRAVSGWTRAEVATPTAPAVVRALGRELSAQIVVVPEPVYVLDDPPALYDHPLVRRLTEDDLSVWDAAPPELRPGGFGSTLAALSGGANAGAIVDGRLVAAASMSLSSERHARLRAHTLEPWRGQGIGTAATSRVALEVWERGLTPVWQAEATDVRSRRRAERLGFREVGTRALLLLGSRYTGYGGPP